MKKQCHLFVFLLVALAACHPQTPEETPKETPKETPYLPCSEEIFMWALAEAESGHNARTVYRESFGVDSVGWFQVSFEDAARYGCQFTVKEDLFDTNRNTDCARRIMKRLDEKYPSENYSRRYGRYWSALRDESWGKVYSGFTRFKAAALSKGCRV
jgi:hypothetical protein